MKYNHPAKKLLKMLDKVKHNTTNKNIFLNTCWTSKRTSGKSSEKSEMGIQGRNPALRPPAAQSCWHTASTLMLIQGRAWETEHRDLSEVGSWVTTYSPILWHHLGVLPVNSDTDIAKSHKTTPSSDISCECCSQATCTSAWLITNSTAPTSALINFLEQLTELMTYECKLH